MVVTSLNVLQIMTNGSAEVRQFWELVAANQRGTATVLKTNLESQYVMDNLRLRRQCCARLKLVNSEDQRAFSPRRVMRFLHVSVSNHVHNIHSCDSSFSVHICVYWIQHFPTSVVLHDDRQNDFGCVGPRPGSCVIKTHHFCMSFSFPFL